MLDNVQDLVLFVKVAELESFTMAGKDMGLSPAVVSKRIQKLENRLGCRLLERTTRQVRVTEVGYDFYQNCTNILSEINKLENRIREHQENISGAIRINTSSILGRMLITPLINSFLQKYPEVCVQMVSTEDEVDLVKEGFDLAVRVVELKDRNYIVRKISGHRAFVCATPGYLNKSGIPKSPQDLRHHNCLVRSNHKEWRFSRNNREYRIKVSGNFTSNDGEVIRLAASLGLGIAPLASWHARTDIESGTLQEILTDYVLSSEESIYVMYSSKQFLPIRVRRFIDHLIANLEATPKKTN